MFQFEADFLHAVDDQLSLPFGEVERFVDLVGEEGVLFHVLSERRPPDQIGMEDQSPPFGLIGLAVVLDADDLPRSQTDECPLLIVVAVSPVKQLPAFDLFEENRIKAECLARMSYRFCLGQIDDADLGMECLDSQRIIVLEDGFDIADSFLHSMRFQMFVSKIIHFFEIGIPKG